MRKLSLVLVMSLVVGPWLMADAQGTTITVYFDRAGTIRTMDSPGSGTAVVYVIGEGFDEIPPWVSGAQYKIDYGPHMTLLADQQLPPAVIGTSSKGISIGFGRFIKNGRKFLIQSALVEWNSDCAAARNASYPVVMKHPDFPESEPVLTRFPDHEPFLATGQRSQLCQLVELDILPGECPNPFSSKLWNVEDRRNSQRGGLIPVAILGSSTVRVRDIDRSFILLEGVAPLRWPQGSWLDVGKADGDNDCECDRRHPGDGGRDRGGNRWDDDDDDGFHPGSYRKDGYKDLLLFFNRADLAAAIAPTAPAPGTEMTLTLTGVYDDGLPFEATDCIVIKGHRGSDDDDDDDNSNTGADRVTAGLGHPSPNPFNPVTRISYGVPATQHVRIAIYDVAGRLVENLVNEVKAPGEYTVEWNAGSLPSGVYFYRMQTGSQTMVRRATLLK